MHTSMPTAVPNEWIACGMDHGASVRGALLYIVEVEPNQPSGNINHMRLLLSSDHRYRRLRK